MAKGFSYTLALGWLASDRAAAASFVSALLPHQRLLLFSEGSMTLELELLSGSRVEAEVKLEGKTALSADEASYLDEDAGSAALEREVWLRANGRRLIYARTLIPSTRIDASIRDAVTECGREPLGRVLSSRGVLFAKERLEVAVVRSAAAAADLSIGADSALFARRYVLFNRNAGRWVIKASVTEIFSPELITAAAGAA